MFLRVRVRRAIFLSLFAWFIISSQLISCSGGQTQISPASSTGSDSSQQVSIKWPAGYTYSPASGALYASSSSTSLQLPSYVTEIKLIISGASAATQVLDVNKENLKVNFSLTPGEWMLTLEVSTNIERTFAQSIDVTCVTDLALAPSDGPTCVAGTRFKLFFDLDVNAPPKLEEIQTSDIAVTVAEQISLEAMASDLDFDPLSFDWDGGGGQIGGSGELVSWSASEGGNYTICAKVDDGNGGNTIGCIVVLVIGASAQPASVPPRITDIFVADSTIEENDTTTATCVAYDPDGDPLSYNWSGPFGWRDSGQTVSYTPTSPGEHILTCTVSDGFGGSDRAEVSLTTTETNVPPIITYITLSEESTDVGASVTATCNAADANGDSLTYNWNGPMEWSDSGPIVMYTPESSGEHILTCSVSDGRGGVDSAEVVVTATEVNVAPVITFIGLDKVEVVAGESVTATCEADDENGDPLTYSWADANTHWTGTGSEVIYTPPSAGLRILTCAVSDGLGGTDSKSVELNVTTGTQ